MQAALPRRIGIPLVSGVPIRPASGERLEVKTATVSTTFSSHGCSALETTKVEAASVSTASPLEGLSDNESNASSYHAPSYPGVPFSGRHSFTVPVAVQESVDRQSIQCATQCASRCASLCADYLFREALASNAPANASSIASAHSTNIHEASAMRNTEESSVIFGMGAGTTAVARTCDHVMRSKGLIERLNKLQKTFPRHHIRGEQPPQEGFNEMIDILGRTGPQPGEAELLEFRTELTRLRQEVVSMHTAREDLDRKKHAAAFNELRVSSDGRQFSQAAKFHRDIVGQQQNS